MFGCCQRQWYSSVIASRPPKQEVLLCGFAYYMHSGHAGVPQCATCHLMLPVICTGRSFYRVQHALVVLHCPSIRSASNKSYPNTSHQIEAHCLWSSSWSYSSRHQIIKATCLMAWSGGTNEIRLYHVQQGSMKHMGCFDVTSSSSENSSVVKIDLMHKRHMANNWMEGWTTVDIDRGSLKCWFTWCTIGYVWPNMLLFDANHRTYNLMFILMQ